MRDIDDEAKNELLPGAFAAAGDIQAVRAQNPFEVPTLPALPVTVDSSPPPQPSPLPPNPLYPLPMPPNPLYQVPVPANPIPPNPAFMPGQVNQGPVFANPPVQYANPVNQAPVYVPPSPAMVGQAFQPDARQPGKPELPAIEQGLPNTAPPVPPMIPVPVRTTPSPTRAYSMPPAESYGQALPESLPNGPANSSHASLEQFRRVLTAPARGLLPDFFGRHAPPAPEAAVEPSVQVPSVQMPMSPVEITVARLKADEANVNNRRTAVRYLGRVDCQFNPEAEEALLSALRSDRSEIVRFEAALALGNSSCSTRRILEALHVAATGSIKDGHPAETSERVKWAALEALHRNTQPGPANSAPPQVLPQPSLVPTGLLQAATRQNTQAAAKHTTMFGPVSAGPATPLPVPNRAAASSPNKSQPEGLLVPQGGKDRPLAGLLSPPKTTAPAGQLPTLTPIGPIPQYQSQTPVYQPVPAYPPPYGSYR